MRVSLVSPNHTLLLGLRELLSRQAGIQVLGAAASLDDLELDGETDVLILASVSPASLSALDEFPAVLLLANDVDEARTLQSSRAKSWGVIPLNASEEELSAAVRAVGEGLWVVAPVFGSDLMRGSLS